MDRVTIGFGDIKKVMITVYKKNTFAIRYAIRYYVNNFEIMINYVMRRE